MRKVSKADQDSEMNIEIKEAQGLPEQIVELEKQASKEGFAFVQRLIDEYQSAKNRFDQPGAVSYTHLRAHET